MKKNILSIALSLAMVAGSFSTAVYAAGEEFTDGTEISAEQQESDLFLDTEENSSVQPEDFGILDAGQASYTGSGYSDNTLRFQPGTYTVTANLYVPGELNTQLPGVTAYMTNPNNPLGIAEDGGSVEKTAPTEPVYNNASLTIGSDGKTKTLTLPVVNPVFTLQDINSGSNVTVVSTERNSTTYSDLQGTVSRTGRIYSLTVTLEDNSGLYTFGSCTEFPTLLGVDWTVSMTMGVDLSGIPQAKEPDPTPSPVNPTPVPVQPTPSPIDPTPTVTPTPVVKEPELLEGNNSKWEKDTTDTLIFRSSADFKDLICVSVDSKVIGEENYNKYSGSTYIELKSSYLQTLKVGGHTISIISRSGSATGVFIIDAAAKTEYAITEGNGSIWTTGSGEALLFNSDVKENAFTGVSVDGKELTDKEYKKFAGSAYVELNVEFLNTLETGSHVLTINAKDGSAYGIFVVKKAQTSQSIQTKVSTKTYKASVLKKKSASFAIGAKAKTTLSYKVTSTPKNASKYISVSKKGKVTMKKKAPKGTYKIQITAKATANYKKAVKTVKVVVK